MNRTFCNITGGEYKDKTGIIDAYIFNGAIVLGIVLIQSEVNKPFKVYEVPIYYLEIINVQE